MTNRPWRENVPRTNSLFKLSSNFTFSRYITFNRLQLTVILKINFLSQAHIYLFFSKIQTKKHEKLPHVLYFLILVYIKHTIIRAQTHKKKKTHLDEIITLKMRTRVR